MGALKSCGSLAAYGRHLKAGEEPCGLCVAAREASKTRSQARVTERRQVRGSAAWMYSRVQRRAKTRAVTWIRTEHPDVWKAFWEQAKQEMKEGGS